MEKYFQHSAGLGPGILRYFCKMATIHKAEILVSADRIIYAIFQGMSRSTVNTIPRAFNETE